MGRRTKGARELLGTRTDTVLAAAARSKAADLGLSVSDYLATILAADLDLPQHAPKTTDLSALELPISDVA